MLTIILGVTTFLFFKNTEEAKRESKELRDKATASEKSLRDAQRECGNYKKLMGYASEADKDTIQDDFVKQMKPFEGLCPKKPDGTRDGVEIDRNENEKVNLQVPSFASLRASQTKELDALKDQLAKETDDKNKFKADYDVREGSKTPEITGLTAARDAAVKQAATYKNEFEKDRERFKGDQAAFAKDLLAARDEGATKVKEKETELAEVTERVETIVKENEKIKKDNETMRGATKKGPVQDHEFPGYITWVDERRGIVYVNLGRADGLQPLTTFSVYPEKPTTVTKESAKASIEITAIRGDHEAEARILPGETSKLADPIMPRDKIYSPVWSRGTKKHFALAGFMDIDGDGRSDLAVVRSLVTGNGGVVDLQLDDKGEQQGAISPETDYLVLGTPPDSRTASKETVDNFSRAVGAAKSNGVKQLKLDEFLQLMGWKQPTSVKRFGAGARPSDTAIKPSDNPPRSPALGGAKDDRFKPRTPPAGGAAGAY
jgi:hypothetical protein